MSFLEHSPFLEEALKPFAASYKSLRPLPLEEQEVLYGISFGFYEAGQYAKAAGFFTQLVLSNPFNVSFWKGLASSKQMEQEYKASVHAWAMVALLDEANPLPHFHAAYGRYPMRA